MNKLSTFFSGLMEKRARFMYGRYGDDQLNRAIAAVTFAMIILGWIVRSFASGRLVSGIFDLIIIGLIVVFTLRRYSKSLYKRGEENRKYLQMTEKTRSWWNLQKRRWRERKTHSFKKCPNCKRVLRLAKKKGKRTAHCPLCGFSFTVKFR